MQEKHTNEPACHTVMYRLPSLHTFHTLDSEATVMSDAYEMAGRTGFAFTPFETNGGDCPTLFFEGRGQEHVFDSGKWTSPQETTAKEANSIAEMPANRESYEKAFAALHGMVASWKLDKVVLSRKTDIEVEKVNPQDIFFRACALHPDAFVAMVRTPRNGTWLCATPELLVEVKGQNGRTMALAGTMPASDDRTVTWDEKNRAEQRVVAKYVRERIDRLATDVNETEPETTRAGNVCHLRSTFTFSIKKEVSIGHLACALHPTPAVCGMPQAEAMTAILANEGYNREYFSGYCGPINMNGESHLFVTLRCMKMSDGRATLYAGGGLMPGSNASDEWDETEAKMQAMRKLLYPESGQR